jgi:hypothetical protein
MGKTRLYLIGGAVILVLFVLVYFWGKGSHQSQSQNEQELAKQYADALSMHGLTASAVAQHVEELRIAFGWNASTFGFDFWTEDEDAIIAVVLLYSASSFPILADAYRLRLKRNLKSDLKEYLSANQYGEIAHIAA